MKTLIVVTLTAITLPILAASQQTRDSSAVAIPTGTSAIRGVVMSDEATPHPMRRAVVTLSGAIPGGRSVITGDDGAFAFVNLPEGAYTVTATKPAYLPAAYGATRPGRPGTAIVLAANRQIDVTLRMARGAVVSGIVRDAKGALQSGVQVAVLDLHTVGGINDMFSSAEFVTTDDRGVYRIFGLMPGDYVVVATTRMALGGTPIGNRSTADNDALINQLRQRGSSPGAAPVVPSAPGRPAESFPPPPIQGYAPTYFPGVVQFRDATHFTLGAAEERATVDFAVGRVGSVSINGVIQGPNPQAVQLSLIVGGPRLPMMLAMNPSLSTPPDADGHFRYTGVTPGQYTIMARGSLRPAPAPAGVPGAGGGRGGGAMTSGGSAPSASGSSDWLYGVADIDVGADDLSVSVSLVPGTEMTGRMVFDATTQAAPADLSKVLVRVGPPAWGSDYVIYSGGTIIGNAFAGAQPVSAQKDGTFVVHGLAPGQYTFYPILAADVAKAFWLRSAVVDGTDVLDSVLEARGGVDLTDVVLTFSDRHTELTGRLTTQAGEPAPEYYVVVLPADKTLWRANARRVKTTRPSTDGTFTIRDLPAGDYLIAALTDVAPNEWNDVRFLAQVAPLGVPFTLGEGEKKRQDLRIAKWRP